MHFDVHQNHTPSSRSGGSMLERNPDEWITGTEPMTSEQKTYLKILSEEAGEYFDESLSMAAANERIVILEQKTGRKI